MAIALKQSNEDTPGSDWPPGAINSLEAEWRLYVRERLDRVVRGKDVHRGILAAEARVRMAASQLAGPFHFTQAMEIVKDVASYPLSEAILATIDAKVEVGHAIRLTLVDWANGKPLIQSAIKPQRLAYLVSMGWVMGKREWATKVYPNWKESA